MWNPSGDKVDLDNEVRSRCRFSVNLLIDGVLAVVHFDVSEKRKTREYPYVEKGICKQFFSIISVDQSNPVIDSFESLTSHFSFPGTPLLINIRPQYTTRTEDQRYKTIECSYL